MACEAEQGNCKQQNIAAREIMRRRCQSLHSGKKKVKAAPSGKRPREVEEKLIARYEEYAEARALLAKEK